MLNLPVIGYVGVIIGKPEFIRLSVMIKFGGEINDEGRSIQDNFNFPFCQGYGVH